MRRAGPASAAGSAAPRAIAGPATPATGIRSLKATDGPIALGLWPETFRRDPHAGSRPPWPCSEAPPGRDPAAPGEDHRRRPGVGDGPSGRFDASSNGSSRSAADWVLALDPIDNRGSRGRVPPAMTGASGPRRATVAFQPHRDPKTEDTDDRSRACSSRPSRPARPTAAGPKTLFRPEMFETLVNPACSHCVDESRRKAGDLRDDDRVLAWIRGKYDGGAIPYRWFLVPYRVISDTYGVFVYDADADFVRGWPASLDYRFHGWRNGVMVMRHKDGTLFDCLTGVAFDGPRKGERLTPIPTIETDWGPWLKANPGTVAYAMVSKFQPQSAPKSAPPRVAETRPEPDPRLDAEERVFGLALGGASRAWPLRSFGERPELRNATSAADRPSSSGTPGRGRRRPTHPRPRASRPSR